MKETIVFMNEILLTPQSLQEKLHIKKSTYYRWRNEKSLPVYKVDRKIYHKESEVNDWFKNYKVV